MRENAVRGGTVLRFMLNSAHRSTGLAAVRFMWLPRLIARACVYSTIHSDSKGQFLSEVYTGRAFKAEEEISVRGALSFLLPGLPLRALSPTRPFHELDNVIMTPHKPTIEMMKYRWSEIAVNIAHHVSN